MRINIEHFTPETKQWLNDNVGRYKRYTMGWHRGEGWRTCRFTTDMGERQWAVVIDNEKLATLFLLRWS